MNYGPTIQNIRCNSVAIVYIAGGVFLQCFFVTALNDFYMQTTNKCPTVCN